MKKVVFENEHRRKHFDFFKGMNHPHFNITANIDISHFLSIIKQKDLPFTFSLVHVLSTAAHQIEEFCWRIRDNEVIAHATVHPSFTVNTDDADVFSFCTVPYSTDKNTFIADAHSISELMKTKPSIEDEPGRDDYLFMSAIPWVSFTSIIACYALSSS